MPTGEISAGLEWEQTEEALHLVFQKIIGQVKEKVNFSIDTDEETLQGQIDFIDPNYNFLGNSIGYSLYSVGNDRPNQGYENTLIGAWN